MTDHKDIALRPRHRVGRRTLRHVVELRKSQAGVTAGPPQPEQPRAAGGPRAASPYRDDRPESVAEQA